MGFQTNGAEEARNGEASVSGLQRANIRVRYGDVAVGVRGLRVEADGR